MPRILIIIGIVLILVIAGGAAFFFLAPPEMKQQLGVGEAPTPTPGALPTPTEDPGKDIVVARFDLSVGTYISDTQQLLDISNLPTEDFNKRQDVLIEANQMSLAQGKVLNTLVPAGQPIEKSFLMEPGLSQQIPTARPNRPRPKAYPLVVGSLSGVADRIEKGDLVDVVLTFKVTRKVRHPAQIAPVQAGGEGTGQVEGTQGFTTIQPGSEDIMEFYTTKTLLQQVKVLAILRPPPPTPVPAAEGEGEEEEPEPEPEEGAEGEGEGEGEGQAQEEQQQSADHSGKPGRITLGMWQVVLAVSNQEAELLEFANQTDARITLVLRGAGDTAYESTVGTTFDLLIDEFGLPMPVPEDPFVFSPNVLTPQPTRTPLAQPPLLP